MHICPELRLESLVAVAVSQDPVSGEGYCIRTSKKAADPDGSRKGPKMALPCLSCQKKPPSREHGVRSPIRGLMGHMYLSIQIEVVIAISLALAGWLPAAGQRRASQTRHFSNTKPQAVLDRLSLLTRANPVFRAFP